MSNNPENVVRTVEDIAENIVGEDVYCCASYMISELSSKEEYMDELMKVMSKEDWETPAKDHVLSMENDELQDYLETELDEEYDEDEPLDRDVMEQTIFTHLDEVGDGHQEFCEDQGLEAHVNEAYEHWIVSDYLARKLQARGEMVTFDFLNLTIWGRTTSGQAICMDGVIQEIAKDISDAR